MTHVLADQILQEAQKLQPQLIQFMRDLISIPGESCNEKNIILRLKQEMEKVGFDEITIDNMGNIIGRYGSGKTKIMMDGHVDTVGTGDINEWKIDPYEGIVKDGIIYGRGASDQRAALVSMIYAIEIIKKLNLQEDYTLYVVGSCQEEDCEGLCILNIIEKEKLFKPDFVLLTEATNLNIYRGHRGRLVMKVKTTGQSAHASVPERGVNAIYLMNSIIEEIEKLNNKLTGDEFLGKGSICVTRIESTTPALCAIPNECTIYIDRRLTVGETRELALLQIKDIINKLEIDNAEVEVMHYVAQSWKGLQVEQDNYFPTWVLPEDHILTKTAVLTAETIFKNPVKIGRWKFSTNGVATMGHLGIPTVGFGPADEIFAHTVNDQVPVDHLVKATAFYSLFPVVLTGFTQEKK